MYKDIQKAQQGDPEAFVRLFEAHKLGLYRLARRLCREPMDAEDALAQTALDAWEKLGTLRKLEGFKSWLYRILANNCRDLLRKKSRLVSLDEVEETGWEADDPGGLYFRELMATLSPGHRVVLELYYGQGFSSGDIAAILDLPIGTVTSRLKRGRERLKEALEERKMEQ